MSWTFEEARAGYLNLWNKATITPGLDSQHADTFAAKIITNEARYRAVQASTGVPWFFIAALHSRESSCNFDGILHNGQKIIGTGRTSTIEPIGVGPFSTWEESAVDALKSKNLHRVQEWTVERMLYSAEAYNGWGYAGKINSPYVWAGTSDEQTGKYTSDHHFDPTFDDPQLGVAAVLKRLAEKRPDIAAAMRTGPTSLPPAPQIATAQEILSPLPKIDPNTLAPLLNAALPVLLQLLTARLQPATGAQPGQGIDLAGILGQLLGGAAPQPAIPPPQPITVVAAPAPPKTGLALSLAGLFGSLGAMATGHLGTPLGMGQDPTLAGNLVPLAFTAAAAIASTGVFGPAGAVIGRVLGAVGPALRPPTK